MSSESANLDDKNQKMSLNTGDLMSYKSGKSDLHKGPLYIGSQLFLSLKKWLNDNLGVFMFIKNFEKMVYTAILAIVSEKCFCLFF